MYISVLSKLICDLFFIYILVYSGDFIINSAKSYLCLSAFSPFGLLKRHFGKHTATNVSFNKDTLSRILGFKNRQF